MIKILKKMFEANPGKSTIQVKGKCSECGCEVIIDITSSSVGFGLQGGTLYKCAPDAYLAQCPECYKNNPKIEDGRRTSEDGQKGEGIS
jgi:hypothetical protein